MGETYKPVKIIQHTDGWYNLFTGMGLRKRDKRVNTKFGVAVDLDRETLSEIFTGDGIGRRIVQIPADDVVRNWFKVEGDPDGLILNKLEEISTRQNVKEALYWARLFGGSIIVILIDDGQELDQPVNEALIRNVVGLHVYDRYDVQWTSTDLYDDPRDKNFGLPKIYTVSNNTTGQVFRVHESRVIRFEGDVVPRVKRHKNNGWSNSILVGVYDRLRGLADSYAGIEGIITEFIIGKLTIKNLQSLISSREGTELVKKRLDILDMSKHVLNSLLLDEGEEFDRVSASGTQGLSTLIHDLMLALSAAAGIPVIKLFPEQAKGLGGEAFGNIRLYYDDISSIQDEKIKPQLIKLVKYIQLAKELKFNGRELDNWDIVFNPLWQQTGEEISKTRKAQADVDQIYYEMGLPGEIIIANRFGGDTYSSDTVLSEEYLEMIHEVDVSGNDDDDEE